MASSMLSSRRYVFGIASLAVLNFAATYLLAPARFTGPDTPKFLEIGAKAQVLSFWISPDAFDGNYWGVGYPTFLAIVIKIMPTNPIPVIQTLQSVMAALLIVFTAMVTRNLGNRISILAAFITAISPTTFYLAWNGGYEVLLGFLIGVSIVLLWSFQVHGTLSSNWLSWIKIVFAGLAMGMAFMTQNKVVVLLPIFFFVLWRISRRGAAWFAVSSVLIPLAWGFRNALVLGTLSPFSNNAEINFWIGNNSESIAGQFMEPPPLPLGISTYREGAISFFINQPEATVTLFLRKLASLAQPTYIYPDLNFPPGGSTVLHYTTAFISLAILAGVLLLIGGLVWNPKAIPAHFWWLAITYIAFVLVNLPFIAEARFRAPLEWLAIAIAVPTFATVTNLNVVRLRGSKREHV